MARFVLLMAVMFVLPFVLWHLGRMVAATASSDQKGSAPNGTLFIAGLVLAIATAIALAVLAPDSGSGDGRYHPPRIVDGEIQPGYFEPEDDSVPDDDPPEP